MIHQVPSAPISSHQVPSGSIRIGRVPSGSFQRADSMAPFHPLVETRVETPPPPPPPPLPPLFLIIPCCWKGSSVRITLDGSRMGQGCNMAFFEVGASLHPWTRLLFYFQTSRLRLLLFVTTNIFHSLSQSLLIDADCPSPFPLLPSPPASLTRSLI